MKKAQNIDLDQEEWNRIENLRDTKYGRISYIKILSYIIREGLKHLEEGGTE